MSHTYIHYLHVYLIFISLLNGISDFITFYYFLSHFIFYFSPCKKKGNHEIKSPVYIQKPYYSHPIIFSRMWQRVCWNPTFTSLGFVCVFGSVNERNETLTNIGSVRYISIPHASIRIGSWSWSSWWWRWWSGMIGISSRDTQI